MAPGMVAENISVCRLRRKLGHDFADVVDKTHVEHAVGFVEHETLDAVEPKRIALDEIEKPAGRGDENIDAVHKAADLRAHRDAADHQRGSKPQMPAVSAEAVENLARQFARRAQHQHAAGFVLERARIAGEAMQDRQRESRGFAGSGLRDADDIAARHHGRDGLRLDRRRGYVFLFG